MAAEVNRLAQHYPVQCHWEVGLFSAHTGSVPGPAFKIKSYSSRNMQNSPQNMCCEDSPGNQGGGNSVGVHGQFNAKLLKRAQVLFRHKTEIPQRLAEERWDWFFSQSSEWERWEAHRETGYIWNSISTSVGISVGNQAPGRQVWRAWLSLPCSSGEPAKCSVCIWALGWEFFSCRLCLAVTTQSSKFLFKNRLAAVSFAKQHPERKQPEVQGVCQD